MIPSIEELRWAGKGGHSNWIFSTDDGTITSENTVYNGGWDKSKGKHKGHPQVVAYFESKPNPYGVYDLSGNVVEWTKTRNSPRLKCIYTGCPPGFEAFIALGGGYAYWKEAQSTDMRCRETPEFVNNDHFGFRVVKKNN